MTSLRQTLRAATQTAHLTLEHTMSLDPATLTRQRYGQALQVLHAVRAGWEPKLAAYLQEPAGPHLTWLEFDLQVLALPTLPPLSPPTLASEPEAWGFTYVLEGSALGGRSMLQDLTKLGLLPNHGARYFAGRGKETGPHWSNFLARMEAQASETNTPLIVSAAQAAFASLERAARRHLPVLSEADA